MTFLGEPSSFQFKSARAAEEYVNDLASANPGLVSACDQIIDELREREVEEGAPYEKYPDTFTLLSLGNIFEEDGGFVMATSLGIHKKIVGLVIEAEQKLPSNQRVFTENFSVRGVDPVEFSKT